MVTSPASSEGEQLDVLILGAGPAGINAAYQVRSYLPAASFAVLESRDQIGGTWTFWKYPGFRCDSPMSSYAFTWHPWAQIDQVVSGQRIAAYIDEAVEKENLRRHIRLNHKVKSLDWRSDEARWVVEVEQKGERGTRQISARWVVSCMGYYRYDKALAATIPGIDNFGGQVIHPQWWPEDTDLTGKKVVILGSGSTAMTIFPAITDQCKQVTLLQRSPSYVASIPSQGRLQVLFRLLPYSIATRLVRFFGLILEYIFVILFQRFPDFARDTLRKGVVARLGQDYPVDVHFKPRYKPWQQRMILSKDGELFDALRKPNAEMATGTIESVDKGFIHLASGQQIEADVIITATGLHVDPTGNAKIAVDGVPVDPHDHFAWRGFMLDRVPNFGFITGFLVGSYTPGANALTQIFIDVIKHAEKYDYSSARPEMKEDTSKVTKKSFMSMNSTYFVEAEGRLPVVTGKGVWYGRENLWRDTRARWFGGVTEGMRYERVGEADGAKKRA